MNPKILIVGPSWVGDLMMSHTMMQLLCAQNPTAEIHVLAPAWCEALLSRMPGVAKSIVSPFLHGQFSFRARMAFAKTLKKENYNHAIVLPNSLKSALIPFLARIPKRTGWVGECRFGLLNDARFLDKKKYTRMVERFAALAFPANTALPNLPFPKLVVNEAQVRKTLTACGVERIHFKIPCFMDDTPLSALENEPSMARSRVFPDATRADKGVSSIRADFEMNSCQSILALCPGAEFGPSKQWPAEHFATVANQCIEKNWQVWLLGSAKDQEIAARIQTLANSRCVDFTGKTNLSQAVDLLSLVDCVVTNDSGLMHVAAALNKHVIALYGPTSPNFTPPFCRHATVLKNTLPCQPCFKRQCPLQHHRCMQELSPESVISEIYSSRTVRSEHTLARLSSSVAP